jgi:hypothetical protein
VSIFSYCGKRHEWKLKNRASRRKKAALFRNDLAGDMLGLLFLYQGHLPHRVPYGD